MNPKEAMKKRLEARKKVQEFFKAKRKALKVGPFWDFSAENRLKRNFLARMNAIARDLEFKAMDMAEKGEDYDQVLKEAEKELEKLKKEFLEEIGENAPWGMKFKDLIETIKSL